MALLYQNLVVAEYEKALIYTNGRYTRTVGPGNYRLWKPFLRQGVSVFDMRRQSITIAGQEILTNDPVPIRITQAATYEVIDPVAAAHKVDYWSNQLYIDLQLALREIVASLSFDEALAQKNALGDQVLEQVKQVAEEYGLNLLRVAVKDITMPAGIRDIMLKAVEAEKSAQASLIKAREEVAAARARANAAKMIADNPALLRLKELETLTELAKSPASTVVFTHGTDVDKISGAVLGNGNSKK